MIAFAEEQQLLESGVLMSTETRTYWVVQCCFYHNKLNLILSGRDERRTLKISQFRIQTVQDPDDPFSLTSVLLTLNIAQRIAPEVVSSWILQKFL